MKNERLEKILDVLNSSSKALTLAELVSITGYSRGCIYWFLKNDVYGINHCSFEPIVYYTNTNIDIVTPEELNKQKPKKKRITRKSKPVKVLKLNKSIFCNARGRNISSDICIPNKNHNDCNICEMMELNCVLAVA